MNTKIFKTVAVVFIVLTIVMSALFVFENSSAVKSQDQYNSLQAKYEGQQSSVVLDNAYAHWNYIAIENTTLLKGQYASNATLDWIGGPLTGTYSGIGSIISTWSKFFGLWSAVWFYTVSPPVVSVSGNTATVLSENQFVLTPVSSQAQAQYLNISYRLDYIYNAGTWLIYGETWHIVGSGFVSASQKFTDINYVENLAFSHWNNIAIENSTTVMDQYASNATLYWIGGPLNGTYSGTAQINSTWNKFFGLWSAVWFYAESPPTVNVSGNTASVKADVQFIVQSSSNSSQFKYINVTYDLEYYSTGLNVKTGIPNYMITSEVFQITGSNLIDRI